MTSSLRNSVLHKPWFPFAALFTLVIVLYTQNIADRSFWTANEAYYSAAAKSILSGQLLTPETSTGKIVDKPPLAYWSVALAGAAAGGVSEWSSRIANIVPAVSTLIILALFLRRRLDPAAAFAFVAVCAFNYEYLQIARAVSSDMLLTFFLAVAWASLYGLLTGPFRWSLWVGLAGGCGLAMMVKGPVAPVLTAMIGLGFAFARYGRSGALPRVWRMRAVSAGAASLLPFVAWAALLYSAQGGQEFYRIVIEQNIVRFLAAGEVSHERPWPYFFGELPVGFMPWSLLFPFAAWHLWKHRTQLAQAERDLSLFSLVAVGAVFAFFTVSTSKRDYYILPLYPWLAVFLAIYLRRCIAGVALPSRAQAVEFWRSIGHSRVLQVAAAMLVALAGYGFVLSGVESFYLEERNSPREFAAQVDKAVDSDDRLIIFDEEEPQMLYYITEKFQLIDDERTGVEQLRAIMSKGGEFDILVDDKYKKKFTNSGLGLHEESEIKFKNDTYVIMTNEPPESSLPPVPSA